MTQSEPQELCPSGEGLGVGAGGGVCGMGQRWETKRMTKTDREQEAVSEMETEMKWCNVSGSIKNWRAAHCCSPRVKRGRVGWGGGVGEIGGREEKKKERKPVQRADCPVHVCKGNNMAPDSFAGPLKVGFITGAYLHAYGTAFCACEYVCFFFGFFVYL